MVQKNFIMLLATLLLVGCPGGWDGVTQAGKALAQETSTGKPRKSVPGGSEVGQESLSGHQLIFFLDPNGRPCQIQAQILEGLGEDLGDRVTLRHIQTTVAADREVFYRYGIRSLPSLVLADADGKEIGRLPPGVKGADDILRLIDTIPGL